MINNISIPEYKELWPLLNLDGSLNGCVANDSSMEVMLRIEQSLQRLQEGDIDGQRTLWLEIHLPGRNYYWGEDKRDKNGNIWYRITTGCYRDMHYLLLYDTHHKFIDLRSQPSAFEQRNPGHQYYDVRDALLRLEKYLSEIVDSICTDPDSYNEYIAVNLPFWKRHGEIKRSALNRICPSYRRVDNPEKEILLLEKMLNRRVSTFSEMTLNIYMHYWRMAYVAYRTMSDFEPSPTGAFAELSDREIFKHSSKGYHLEGYDLDSQDDFIRWEAENSPYHCLDVAYARIHLWPVRDKNGLWHFETGFHVRGYFRDMLNIVRNLYDQGVIVGISYWADEALAQLKEEDTVTITPCPDKYREEIHLPYAGDGITRKMVNAIIRETTWKAEKPVLPRRQEQNSGREED